MPMVMVARVLKVAEKSVSCIFFGGEDMVPLRAKGNRVSNEHLYSLEEGDALLKQMAHEHKAPPEETH
jgi:hypothetical protein